MTMSGHQYGVWCVSAFGNINLPLIIFLGDSIVASGSPDHKIKLWDIRNGSCINTLEGHEKQVKNISSIPERNFLASGDYNGIVKFWDYM